MDAAFKAGYDPTQIRYASASIGLEELLYLIDAGVCFTVDSEPQLIRLVEQEAPVAVSVCLNPSAGKESHPGVWGDEATAVYSDASRAGVIRFGAEMRLGEERDAPQRDARRA